MKVSEKTVDEIVEQLIYEVSDVLEDGEWNEYCDIDLFFDAISDGVGEEHMEANLGEGRFPDSLRVSGKPNSEKLKSSIRSKVKMLIKCMEPAED